MLWTTKRFFKFEPDGVPAGAPAAVEAPSGDQPRDDHGRFTAAAIERAAMGLTDDGNPSGVTAPAVPAAVAPAEATPPAAAPAPVVAEDPFKDLDAFLGTAEPAGEAPTTPAPVMPAAQPASAAFPSTPEVGLFQTIAANPQAAAEAAQALQTFNAMNQATARGDIAGVLSAFPQGWSAALEEHFYQTNKDKYAQRYTDEANGTAAQRDPRLDLVLQQIAELRQNASARQQQEQSAAQQRDQQQQLAQVGKDLRGYVDSLFSTVKLQDSEHRPMIQAWLVAEVNKNPKAVANIRAGRFGDLGTTFRALVPKIQPLLQAGASTPQPAAQPSGAASLMQSASAATSTTNATPEIDPRTTQDTSGNVPGSWLAQKLKKLAG